MKKVGNLTVGKPDTSPSKSAHTRGVREGHEPGAFEKTPGLYTDGKLGKGTARRSTGINPEEHEPIDPRMPTLTPA